MSDGPVSPPPGGMPGAPASLVDRVKNIITSPSTEWARIDAEPATVAGLFTGYAMILAAIGPVATVIGLALVGFPLPYAIANAVIGYIVSLATVFIVSLIIDALAPSFGGTKNQVQATKVAVYSATPVWLLGILSIIPQLLPLMIVLGLVALAYGIYLMYLGLPRLMRVSADKAVGYVVVVAVLWLVVSWVLLAVVAGVILSSIGFGIMSGAAMRY
jgi:hypothetical protein